MDVSALIRKTALNQSLDDEERQALLHFAEDYTTQIETWRATVENAAAERDSARTELAAFKRRERVGAIARECGFSDAGYLDFLLRQREVELEDAAAVATAVTAIKNDAPRLFNLDLEPGAGSGPSRLPGAVAVAASGGAGDLARLLENAPEINA